MPARYESRVTKGNNDYRFVASLHARHPSVDPDEITAALKQEPRTIRRRGERRRSPDGALLTGYYDENYWSIDFKIVADHDVSEFLHNLIYAQMPRATEFTRRIDDTGESVSVFIGVFADGFCDFEIPAATLRLLGEAGVSVRLDYYGADNDRARESAEPPDAAGPAATKLLIP